jgi:hypothetical protein
MNETGWRPLYIMEKKKIVQITPKNPLAYRLSTILSKFSREFLLFLMMQGIIQN